MYWKGKKGGEGKLAGELKVQQGRWVERQSIGGRLAKYEGLV